MKAQVDSLLAYQRNCVAATVNVARPVHGHYTWMSEVWTRSNWFKDDGGEHDRCNRGGNIYIGNTQGKWKIRLHLCSLQRVGKATMWISCAIGREIRAGSEGGVMVPKV